jgi:hypothetical protein
VLDYLSHHLYLSTARALSKPRTPPPTDLAPASETATITVNPAESSHVPLDPNGELDEGEDLMEVEGAPVLADSVASESDRPSNPDDVEMTDDRPPIARPSELTPAISTATDTSQVDGVSGKVEGTLTEQELSQIEYRRGQSASARPAALVRAHNRSA